MFTAICVYHRIETGYPYQYYYALATRCLRISTTKVYFIWLRVSYRTSLTARAGVSGRRNEKWIRMARSFKRNPHGLHILQIDLSAAYNVSELAHVITTDVMPLTPCVTQPRVFVGFASGVSKPRGDRERLYSLSCRQENAESPCEKG
jgi:hypothetical protein